MKKLFSILFLIFSLTSFSQTIKQKQVEGLSDSLREAKKIDTADFFGIDSSLTFSNITELRATQLYNKGGRLATTFGYYTRNDGGGSDYIWNPSSTATDDGILIFKPDAISSGSPGRWEWRAKGKVRASEVGVKSDGTDQTGKLNSLFSLSTVKEVVFDNGDVKITGKVNSQGKKLTFENSARIIGASGSADTLTNLYINASLYSQIFDTLLTVTDVLNQTRSVKWFGAVPDYNYTGGGTPTNNLTAFNTALSSGKNQDAYSYFQVKSRIYIPSDAQHYYYLGGTWTINAAVEIYGDGERSSVLVFPNNVVGVNLSYVSYQNSSRYAYLHDFMLRVGGINTLQSTTTYNANATGLWIQSSYNRIERIIVENFSGDGILISGYNPSSIANNNSLSYVHSNGNSGCGVKLIGSDANVNMVLASEAIGNVKWGFADSSFLGNTIINCHAASNATSNIYSNSGVSIGGKGYIARQDAVGIKPETTPGWENYWVLICGSGCPPGGVYKAWDTTYTYYAAGGYYFGGANQHGFASGNYSEFDEYVGRNDGNTIVISGFSSYMDGGNIFTSRLGNTQLKKELLIGAGSDVNDFTNGFIDLDGKTSSYYKIGWQANGYDAGFTFGDEGSIALVYNHSSGNNYWFSNAHDASIIGRYSWPGNYNYSTETGLFNKPFDETYFHFRQVTTSWAKPTTGKWADGDWVVNIGSDSTVTGWRCLTAGDFAGTPPTFLTVKSGNGVSGGGTWGSITGTLSSQSDLQSALNAKLNITDTTNKWVTSVFRRSDSVFYVKGGVAIFAYKDSVGTGGSGSPGGASGSIQYNNSGSFGAFGSWNGTELAISGNTSTGTSTPVVINSGGTYGTNTAGSPGNLKWKMYYDGSPTVYGLGISGGIFEYQSGGDHVFYGSTTERFRITNGGKVGIGVSPTALLHIKAGTASANTAPLKLTAGTNLTTPEDGAVEYNGTHFYATIGSTRYQLDQQGGGTTTNALTFNNSGSGDASGSTFDGSAAKTLSYNSIGAQGALTLTTTNSSGAATLVGNTLNIPNYSNAILSASATLDFPTTTGQNNSDLTITVTGAAVGDPVSVGYGAGLVFNKSCVTAFVSATDTVTVRFNNYDITTNSVDPTSTTVKVKVFK